MTKLFLCYWSEGYCGQKSHLVNLEQLEIMYGEEDKYNIIFDDMAKGDVVNLSDLSGIQYILRVQ
jgi:hypothetical protein